MKCISRHMEQLITELSKSYPAVLLTEPRQMGKTTMLRELAKRENIGCEYVSLDDLTTRALAKNDPALFMQLHKPTVLIDEVQYAPELFTYIKSIGNPRMPFSADLDRLLAENKSINPLTAPETFRRIWHGCMPGLISG